MRPSARHSYRQYNGEDCGLIYLAFPARTVSDLLADLGDGFHPNRLLEPNLYPTVALPEMDRLNAAGQFLLENRKRLIP